MFWTLISKAASLATDLAYAARLHKGETSNRLTVKAAEWAAALLERVSFFYQQTRGMDKSQVEDLYGTYPETAVTNVLVILNLVAEGFRGGFDFGPTIQRIELILPYMPTEYETQNRQVLAGLKAANSRQHAAVDAQDRAAGVACSIVGRRNRAQLMNASSLQKALQAGSDGDKVLALFELSNFFANLKVNEEYRQADLQDQPSLGPLVVHALRLLEPWSGGILEDDIIPVTICFILSEHAKTFLSQLSSPSKVPSQALVKNLETMGTRLLALLKAHTSDLSVRRGLFLGFSAVAQSANATWASKAAILGTKAFCGCARSGSQPRASI
jgi:hypothetical protein